jgi:2-keto-4-pentenoate hydratase/2-oxohepta-3-ene-1,7-dioic acid hydratase in catechol pathway
MRLVSFHAGDKKKLGALVDTKIIDVNAAAAEFGLPGVNGVLEALELPDGLSRIAAILAAAKGKRASWLLESSDVRLTPPIPASPKILAVAFNYYDACQRGNIPIPTSLKVFSKLPTTVIGPEDAIELPAGHKVTYEGELGVVIGRRGRNIAVSEAWDYVAGYTVLNDLTANDVTKADVQLMRGKNFDTFCPIGPALVTKDEVPDPYKLNIKTTVNGVVRQDSTIGQMIFKIPEIINYFASFLTLEPGDVLATGTPAGTALQHDPPAFLAVGDLVTVAIEGLGEIANRVVPVAQGVARVAANPAIL